jgi:hypothetical protein
MPPRAVCHPEIGVAATGNRPLFEAFLAFGVLADLKDFGAAMGAGSRDCGATVLHGDRLLVVDGLGQFAFHAVASCH